MARTVRTVSDNSRQLAHITQGEDDETLHTRPDRRCSSFCRRQFCFRFRQILCTVALRTCPPQLSSSRDTFKRSPSRHRSLPTPPVASGPATRGRTRPHPTQGYYRFRGLHSAELRSCDAQLSPSPKPWRTRLSLCVTVLWTPILIWPRGPRNSNLDAAFFILVWALISGPQHPMNSPSTARPHRSGGLRLRLTEGANL